jgi:glycosyltransferase involved in cell wall biosynthesis
MGYLLSICIPTFNRAELLKNTLTSIYSQKANHSDFEVVISDNCSTDHTEEVVLEFLNNHKNINYIKLLDPIYSDNNIVNSLSKGTGLFLKLCNDTALFEEGSINSILNVIRNNFEDRPLIFFSNIDKNLINQRGSCFNKFIQINSFLATSILSIGMWRHDYENLLNIENAFEYNLPALNLLRKNFDLKRNFIVYNVKIFTVQYVKNKGGYNIIDVFVSKYLGKVLRSEYQNGNIKLLTFEIEKIKVLVKFIAPWLKILKKKNSGFTFGTEGANSKLFKIYYYNPLFYLMVIFFFFYDLKIKFFKE